jgi:heat shock protein HslJ
MSKIISKAACVAVCVSGLLIGCGSQQTVPTMDQNDVIKGDLVKQEMQLEPALAYLKQNQWLWQGSYYNNDTTLTPPKPMNYQVAFSAEGTLNIVADCNHASTNYSVDKQRMIIDDKYRSTRAYCGDSSLDQKYLGDLMRVNSWMISGAKLILELNGHAGRMEFRSNE